MIEKFLKLRRVYRILTALLVLLAGGTLLWLGLNRTVTLVVDGSAETVRTSALCVSGVLRSAGIRVTAEDRVEPPLNRWIWRQSVINIDTAHSVTVHTPEDELVLLTPERIPANILLEAGITLYPQDQVLVNGAVVDPDLPVETAGVFLLQFQPAVAIELIIDGAAEVLYTNQPTLGAALEAAAISLSTQDYLSEDSMTPVQDGMQVTLRRAKPVTVRSGDVIMTGQTAAKTVGEALQDLGFGLQNLDYSVPEEDAPLTADAEIEVIRVSEALSITTDEVPFENSYVEDPEALLDTYSVVEPGQLGVFATRERVTYVNGEEVRRISDDIWQASEPRDGVMGYGTRVEIRTEVVDGITIEYWRKKTVYATSYKPCDNQGVCHDGTAGGYPLQKGIIAVTPQWYSVPNGLAMADLPVYVPGYGHAIVGDVGGGIPGTPWIDLAYRDENYVSWHHWTTLYFLTPVPAYYPAIIVP